MFVVYLNEERNEMIVTTPEKEADTVHRYFVKQEDDGLLQGPAAEGESCACGWSDCVCGDDRVMDDYDRMDMEAGEAVFNFARVLF